MQYIPGFEFVAGEDKQQNQEPSLLARKQNKKHKQMLLIESKFKIGEVYKITHIDRDKENNVLNYHFVGSAGDMLSLEFASSAEADAAITKLI